MPRIFSQCMLKDSKFLILLNIRGTRVEENKTYINIYIFGTIPYNY